MRGCGSEGVCRVRHPAKGGRMMRARSIARTGSGEMSVEAGVRRWTIKSIVGIVTVAWFLFLPAGRLDWWMGWALVAVWVVWQGAVYLLLKPRNPALLAERASGPRGDDRKWDTVILSIDGMLTMAQYVVAGLDVRLAMSTIFRARCM